MKIDADWNLTSTNNPEVKQRWFPIGIEKNYAPVFEPAHEFVSVQGRMKYLNPIYLALDRNGHRDLALKWFNENKNFYHPIAVNTLKRLLDIKEEEMVDMPVDHSYREMFM